MSESYAVLESRIPEIIAGLPLKLDGVAEAGADLVVGDAKEKVDVDTGRLKDRIHKEKIKKGTWAAVAGDEEAFYGHMLEHGTTHSPPHPFLIPAMEEDRPEVIALAEAAVRETIELGDL